MNEREIAAHRRSGGSSGCRRRAGLAALALALSACIACRTTSARPLGNTRPTTERPGLSAIACEGASARLTEARTHAESSVLFGELLRACGRPESCHASLDGDSYRLEYASQKGCRLRVRWDAAIESFEIALSLRGLDRTRGLELLKEQMAHDMSTCTPDWSAPPERVDDPDGSHHLIYRGGVCNCSGRLSFRDGELVGLAFSSAC